MQRFLARVALVAPPNSWALKGGLVMIARFGSHARATADADVTWRAETRILGRMLDEATSQDLGDHFEFFVGASRPLQAEGPEGGLRFPVDSRLAGRQFEPMRLDVNLVSNDLRPVERIRLRNLFDFANLAPVEVPAVRTEQQLAEKLHAYTRDDGNHINGRAKDLYDMLVIAEQLPLPDAAEFSRACRETFALRITQWPPTLAPPPTNWESPWAEFVRTYGISFSTLGEAYAGLIRLGSHTFW